MSVQTKRLATTFFFILVVFNAQGQYENQQLPKFLLPPPNAFQITKTADLNVGMHTGTANLSIPLFDITVGGKKFPLSLNYSSNGVLVDEIPSRVGVNWTFNPGGVITRTVLDEDDEMFTLKPPPQDPWNMNQLTDYVYPMMPINYSDQYNTQPDEYRFSFGSFSGKFFYDHINSSPRLTSFSNIKIEKNIPNTVWKFKVTTEDGVIYYFGGPNATEKSKYSNSGCARDMYAVYSEVAWYLKKVEFPNGETMIYNYSSCSFSYTGSVAQTFVVLSQEEAQPTGMFGSFPGNSSVNTCQQITNQLGVVLNNIVCSNGVSVSFSVNNREDISGEYLYDYVTQYYNGDLVNRFKFSFAYSNSNGAFEDGYYNSQPTPIGFCQKRPFLVAVDNMGKIGSETLSTTLLYNDMNGLPPRLSTAHDHLGYFNGKHNQFYVPALSTSFNGFSMATDVVDQNVIDKFQNTWTGFGGANKEPDFNYAIKGSLSKITYPTGGSTSIEWESNTINKYVTVYPQPVTETINAVGTCQGPGGCNTTVVRYFSLSYSQSINLNGHAGMVVGEDNVHSNLNIEIFNTANNSPVYFKNLKFNQSVVEPLSLPAGSYRLELTSTSNDIPGSLTYTYRPGNIINAGYDDIPVPGLRVKKLTDFDGNVNTNIRKYNYHSLEEPGKSSGMGFDLRYFSNIVTTVSYGYLVLGEPIIMGDVTQMYYKLQSSSAFSSYLSGNSSINYSHVLESFGNDYENGGIEHRYSSGYNQPGQILHGNEIMNASFADNAFMNGLEVETKYLKKNIASNLVTVSKTINEYSADYRNFSVYNAFLVQSRNQSSLFYQWAPTSNPLNIRFFDIMMYPRYSSWVHLDKTTNYQYDDNQNEFKTEKTYTYGNPLYTYPTQESSLTSDGSLELTQYKYVKDYASISGISSNSIDAANLMITKNILAPQLEKTVSKHGNVLVRNLTDYKIWNSNMPLPETVSSAFENNAMEPRIRFKKYNSTGNATGLSKDNDVNITYMWGYNNLYPVLEASNATLDEIYYTSFESDNLGAIDENAKTGIRIAQNSFTVNFIKPNSRLYIITYHTWDGSKWNYNEQPYTGNSYTINASKIDEVRIFPKDKVSITTHTFLPLVGISSICDQNNKVVHYIYDAFNRLILIRDEDGNILKKICYNYAGQAVNCITNCTNFAANWQNTSALPICEVNEQNQNTGYQLQQQVDINTCSPSYGQFQWVLAGENTENCPPPPPPVTVNLTSTMISGNYSGYTASYFNQTTQQTYTFNVASTSGLQPLGSLPSGMYNLTIFRTTGTPMYVVFKSGCFKQTASGGSATFYNVNVTTGICNSITLDFSAQ